MLLNYLIELELDANILFYSFAYQLTINQSLKNQSINHLKTNQSINNRSFASFLFSFIQITCGANISKNVRGSCKKCDVVQCSKNVCAFELSGIAAIQSLRFLPSIAAHAI